MIFEFRTVSSYLNISLIVETVCPSNFERFTDCYVRIVNPTRNSVSSFHPLIYRHYILSSYLSIYGLVDTNCGRTSWTAACSMKTERRSSLMRFSDPECYRANVTVTRTKSWKRIYRCSLQLFLKILNSVCYNFYNIFLLFFLCKKYACSLRSIQSLCFVYRWQSHNLVWQAIQRKGINTYRFRRQIKTMSIIPLLRTKIYFQRYVGATSDLYEKGFCSSYGMVKWRT